MTTFAEITAAVADNFGLEPHQIRGPARQRAMTVPRFMAYALCRELCVEADGAAPSYQRIGAHFTGRDHATVIYGIRQHRKRMASPEYRERYESIKTRVAPLPFIRSQAALAFQPRYQREAARERAEILKTAL